MIEPLIEALRLLILLGVVVIVIIVAIKYGKLFDSKLKKQIPVQTNLLTNGNIWKLWLLDFSDQFRVKKIVTDTYLEEYEVNLLLFEVSCPKMTAYEIKSTLEGLTPPEYGTKYYVVQKELEECTQFLIYYSVDEYKLNKCVEILAKNKKSKELNRHKMERPMMPINLSK